MRLQEGGRGLQLVEELAEECGIRKRPDLLARGWHGAVARATPRATKPLLNRTFASGR
jgi:hypothetical protein